MRQTIIFIILLLTVTTSAIAQSGSGNIFVYRNDGKLNAFPRHSVDSLSFSRTDLFGVVHSEPVIQEVWTRDSVYRIPLSLIDSISTKNPETKYAANVKKLFPDYIEYILKVEGMEITFSNNLPHSLRINKGDILLYDKFDELFENGFAGRITSITSGEQITATCEQVELGEIYDQYVAVGDYSVIQDKQSVSGYRIVPRNTTASNSQTIDMDINLSSTLSITGEAYTGIDVRTTTIIGKGNTYIELVITNNIGWNIEYEAQGNAEGSKRYDWVHIPIPSASLVHWFLDIGGFVDASISGYGRLDVGIDARTSLTVVYENGKFSSSTTPPQISEPHFNGEIEIKGGVWTGLSLYVGLETIGSLVEFGVETNIGPFFDFNINYDSSQGNNTYESLKDSYVEFGGKIGAKLRSRVSFDEGTELSICPEKKFCTRTYYLLPDFSKLKIETDSKTISASTTASRKLFLPCEVGMCVSDEDGKMIDHYYHEQNYDFSINQLPLSHKFEKGLKSATKYSISPLLRWKKIEMKGSPTEECYLDCDVHTGRSAASINSAEANGYSNEELPTSAEIGFVYSENRGEITEENAKRCKGTLIDKYNFKGDFSGLKSGTTYYYRAYLFNNDQYYYGDVQCVTTKKDIDNYTEDNFGGDFDNESKPNAQTESSFDVGQREAKIELTFNYSGPSTECGYYLEADNKSGSKISSKYYSLGTVTGRHTVQLDNLIPNTTYRYWAAEKNELGKSTAKARSFKTEPSPSPIANIIEVTDIQMKTATAKCYFENYESPNDCKLEIISDVWSYKLNAHPDENGIAEVKLTKLAAETDYITSGYIVTEEEGPVHGEPYEFRTLEPDITGWWIFNDAQGDNGGRVHDLEIRDNGRTNNFFGVNSMSWHREGRNITMRWGAINNSSTSYWEYRGEFNEDYTYATGYAYYITDSPEHQLYDVNFKSETPFYIRKK